MKNGIGHVFMSVIRERTKPGHTTFIRMPSRASGRLFARPHVFTAAFDAEYDGHDERGEYPAIEDVSTICRRTSLPFPPRAL
jgi:hypothetical protein